MPVTASGLIRPSVEEIFNRIRDKARAGISATLDFTVPAPLGVLASIWAEMLGEAYEALQVAYDGFDRDKTENVLLDALGKLTGTPRRGAAYTEVNTTCTLTAGTALLADTHFAAVSSNPDIRATPKENFTAPTTGSHAVRFRAETTGPLVVPAGELTVIATPVTGWTGITNFDPGFPGHVSDKDPLFRLRQEAELAQGGSATPAAQEAAIAEVAGVQTVKVLENEDDAVNSDGLPGHSTEAIIWDNSGGADDNEIAQAIWGSKAGGCQVHGVGSSGTANDANGNPKTVPFTRSTELEVYLTYNVTRTDKYVGDTAFKAEIEKAANAIHGSGDDVGYLRMRALPFELGLGVASVPSPTLTLGLTASPVATDDIPVTIRQIARFAATPRIVVNS